MVDCKPSFYILNMCTTTSIYITEGEPVRSIVKERSGILVRLAPCQLLNERLKEWIRMSAQPNGEAPPLIPSLLIFRDTDTS